MIAPPRPTSHDELEALIKEARARQLRRRLLGAVGVAIIAALGLSVFAVVTGHRHGNLVQPPANAGRATGPPCRASQLSAGFGFQGATQTMLGGATLRNTSESTCSLPTGRPTFRIVWHGKTHAIPVRSMDSLSAVPPWPRARVVAPGRPAFIVMQWFGLPVIGGAAPPRSVQRLCNRVTGTNFKPLVELQYPGGLRLASRATGLTLSVCGPLHSSWMAVGHPMIER